MNRIKLLSFAVVALLLLNFGILILLFVADGHKGPKGVKMPRELVIEQLHFDENQVEAYEKEIKIHQDSIRHLDDLIRETKNELYQLLNTETIDKSKKDSLIMQLATYQKRIEITHFEHFLAIKKICRKEQLSDYKNLSEELTKIFSHPRKPR